MAAESIDRDETHFLLVYIDTIFSPTTITRQDGRVGLRRTVQVYLNHTSVSRKGRGFKSHSCQFLFWFVLNLQIVPF